MKTILATLVTLLIAAGSQVTIAPAAPVPFTLEAGLITVPVDVGGRTLPLMLDLGDFRAISLTSAVLDTVPVEFTGQYDTFTNFAGDQLRARRFVVRNVGLGTLEHDALTGSEDVYDPHNPSPNPYGAIGRAFFADGRLTMDYRAGTLTLADEPLADALVLPLDTTGGMLRVQAVVDGKPLRLLVDTGAQVSVINPGHFAENTLFQDTHSAYRADSLSVDGKDLGQVVLLRMELGVPDFDGILGGDVLGRYLLQVDLQAGCLRLRER